MIKPESPLNEIFLADPLTVKLHPELQRLPEVREEAPDTLAFIEMVRACGEITEPVRIDPRGYLVDGRRRRLAAEKLGLDLPAIRCSEEDACTIIFNNLVGRRNLGKEVLAYFVLPFIQPILDEAHDRRMRFIKAGLKTVAASSGDGRSIEQIAISFGFSKDTLDTARDARKWFDEHPDKRAEYEARMLAGEISLGGAIQGASGALQKGKDRPPVDVDELVERSFAGMRDRFRKWEKMPVEQRRTFVTALARDASAWPEDVQRGVLTALSQVLKPGKPPAF